MTKEILVEKLPEGQISFRTFDWVTEYNNNASTLEREQFVDRFISEFLNAYGIKEDKLKFKETLKNQLINIGAKAFQPNNPFLEWIVKFNDANGGDGLAEINNEEYYNLINLYSKNIIVDKDLRGNGPRKTETPIFTTTLFKKPLNEITYITQVFYWAQVSGNLNKIWAAFEIMIKSNTPKSKKNTTEFAQLLLGKTAYESTFKNINKENLIDYLLFFEGKFKYNGEYRNVVNIKNAISYLDNYSETSTLDGKDYEKREIDEEKFKGKTIDIDKLESKDAKDLIAYLTKKYGVKN